MTLVWAKVAVRLGIEWNLGLSLDCQGVPSFPLVARSPLYECIWTLGKVGVKGLAFRKEDA